MNIKCVTKNCNSKVDILKSYRSYVYEVLKKLITSHGEKSS